MAESTVIQIGILEDEDQYYDTLISCMNRYSEEEHIAINADRFANGLSLLEKDYTKYDILILDIEVPLLNGMDVARKIREKDQNVTIIFITHLRQYAINGYEVDALDYVIKPIKYNSFKFRFAKAISRVEQSRREGQVVLTVDRSYFRLPVREIFYIEASRHQSIYHTEQGDFKVWKSFGDVKKEMQAYRFVLCHGSYLVNLDAVARVTDDTLVMKNADVLKISRGYKKEVTDALTVFWGTR